MIKTVGNFFSSHYIKILCSHVTSVAAVGPQLVPVHQPRLWMVVFRDRLYKRPVKPRCDCWGVPIITLPCIEYFGVIVGTLCDSPAAGPVIGPVNSECCKP
jgi:hypothetical protein